MSGARSVLELIERRTDDEPWSAIRFGQRGIPPAQPLPLALSGGALRVPRPLALGADPDHRHGNLCSHLERLCRSPDPLALGDALEALGLAGRLGRPAALAPDEHWRTALALAVAACWSDRRPRVIALERWPEMEADLVDPVVDCLERVATDGHGVLLPDGARTAHALDAPSAALRVAG